MAKTVNDVPFAVGILGLISRNRPQPCFGFRRPHRYKAPILQVERGRGECRQAQARLHQRPYAGMPDATWLTPLARSTALDRSSGSHHQLGAGTRRRLPRGPRRQPS
jgi:hypothetical protein